MNLTLNLAEKLLVVLQGSNQTLESQIAASEIVTQILKAEPYGTLARISRGEAQSSEVASHFPNK